MLFSLHLRVAIVATCMALPDTSPAFAQEPPTRSVTLVELDVPADRPAMVYRRAGTGTDRDVIALSRRSTPDDLSSALRVLDALHSRFGNALQRDMAAAVRSERAPARPNDRAEARRKLHGGFVAKLRRAERRQVAGFGAVRAFEIIVPAR